MLRLFVAPDLAPNATVHASENQAHYLGAVMRRNAGETVHLFNGRDGEWAATIGDLRRNHCRLEVVAQIRPQPPTSDLWLLFAPLKRDATDLVIQKATELGVCVIRPVFTARTNAARVNLDRLTAIATEAAEQSERLTVPEIHPPAPFLSVLSAWPANRSLAAAIERAGPSPLPEHAVSLLVGPEGGFTPQELDALRACSFVAPICLGPLVLRAETAIIAGLALLQGQRWSTT